MRDDSIRQVEIDPSGRLLITPDTETFPYVYREAMEVHWDRAGRYLFAPKPREWSYLDWFKHILAAASIQGCQLRVTTETRFNNVPADMVSAMRELGAGAS